MAAMATFIMILLAVATIGEVAAREIPDFLHICNTQDPNYEACISDSIEYLKPYLKTGVPEYQLPALEPLKLEKLTVAPTNSMRIQLDDVVVYGASNFDVTKAKYNFDNMRVYVDVHLPNIIAEGQYNLDGKVLLLPIRGDGPFHGNFTNCIAKCVLLTEKYKNEDGEDMIRIIQFDMKVTVDDGNLKLDNLFDGEQVLGEVINSAINNNFNVFVKEFLPYIEQALSNAFQNIADNIVQQFTFAQLFPGM